MNKKHEQCYCGKDLVRVSGQTHKGKIHLGYYCPSCDVQLGLDLIPLVSYKVVYHLEQDPSLGTILDLYPNDWLKVLTKIMREWQALKDASADHENRVRQQEIKEAAEHQMVNS